jgi:hypothetical protein
VVEHASDDKVLAQDHVHLNLALTADCGSGGCP